MKKNIRLYPSQWYKQACETLGTSCDSVHFDTFKNYEIVAPKGLDLLSYAANMLNEAHLISVEVNIKGNSCNVFPMICLPLKATEKIRRWRQSFWKDLGKDIEPPSLYAQQSKELFGIFSEEYKTPIKFPLSGFKIRAIFRSFRTPEAIENNWEYSNAIYLFCDGDI